MVFEKCPGGPLKLACWNKIYCTLFSKRNASLICPLSLVLLGHWPWYRVLYDPRSSGIQSSPKEMQLPKFISVVEVIDFIDPIICSYACPYKKAVCVSLATCIAVSCKWDVGGGVHECSGAFIRLCNWRSWQIEIMVKDSTFSTETCHNVWLTDSKLSGTTWERTLWPCLYYIVCLCTPVYSHVHKVRNG